MADSLDRLRVALSGRYEIQRELGEGGMATVYLAKDVRHERNVALKVLRPELSATVGTERFLQEVRVTANLQHPHILPLFDSGEADGFLYYVMPYMEGESLRERVEREGELPVVDAVKILRDVVDALSAAHRVGVVHRDIKPDNVLLSGRHAVVTDFGVAKAVSEATTQHGLTTAGVALGTPTYMAPEQAAAETHIDHRADIYAVGAMGYELLAGRPPFTGRTAQQVMVAHVTEAPRPVTESRASVPAALGEVLMRCLEKKPADRWQSAEELLGRLEQFATPSTGITPVQGVPAKAAARGGPPGWTTVAVPALLAVLAWVVWTGGREPAVDGTDTRAAPPLADEIAGPTYVVVPFRNESGVDSLDAFGSVVATYLTSQISRNDIAPVSPSSGVKSLMAGMDPAADPVAYFAEATGARYVVTGSYFAQAGTLVVQAEVAAADGSELVPIGPVEADATDFMGAAESLTEVALGVAARILDPDAAPASQSGQPRSYAAWSAFDEGHDLWFREYERRAALERFHAAIELDSAFVEAYVFASVLEWQLGSIARADSLARIAARYRSGMAPVDAYWYDYIDGWLRGDREAALRASTALYRLTPSVAGGVACLDAVGANRLRLAVEACEAVADYLKESPTSFNFTWAELLIALHLQGEHETELERAREMRALFPDRWGSVHREIRALAALGRIDEVEALVGVLRERQDENGWPLGQAVVNVASDLRAHGHEALSRALAEEALAWQDERAIENADRAVAFYLLGDFGAALALAERRLSETAVGSNPPTSWLGLAGVAAARTNDGERARELDVLLQGIEEQPLVFGVPTRWRAAIAAELGDLDEAVRILRDAYDLGASYTLALRHAPWFARLQGHPGFERFMQPRG